MHQSRNLFVFRLILADTNRDGNVSVDEFAALDKQLNWHKGLVHYTLEDFDV